MSNFRVVICGGGIAAVEGLLRLRRLLGGSAEIELIAPNDELVYRPLAVRQPFAFGPPSRYPLRRIAADCDAEWTKDTLSWVEPDKQVVHTGDGRQVDYDALLVAVGARQEESYEHAGTFRDAEADDVYHGVVQDVEGGYTRSIAFILPVGPTWPLPLYELALMTAERASSMNMDGLELSLVTPEIRPLAIFGHAASDAVTGLLNRAGIKVYSSALAQVPATGQLLIQPQGIELHPDRTIAMPRVAGPVVRGLAGGGAQGFIPIDQHCCVPGTDGHVFAAGDAAAFPIKHGGVGAQMADTAVDAIAALAGASVDSKPFHPVIRGKLLTGADPLYISARVIGAEGFESEVFDSPPWPADEKVVAEELGPYLAQLDGARSTGAPVAP
ncbi:MAG: sulfide:quinone oxidoreductase [Thermoleophilaceae bacterium]|nr:sulfide:quinone oxidoreductase [Thermoleophilaceae bacterium]